MIGQTISHYRITEKLGEGGMGVVYKAEDTKLERTVALKFLAAHLLNDEEAKARFLREAKAAAGLHHPNICPVYEIGEAESKTFISMAFIEGEPLEAKIERGPLSLKEALDIGRQIADGLEAAHEKGVVHRDIKPTNVMVDAKGHSTIMDFGLARLTEASRLTKADQTMGTVAYMSPEQAQGMEVDGRTDLWALGCVLYEMVAGARPFKGEYDQALLYEIVHQAPEPLTGVRAGVPMELELLVAKCLAKEANSRYQNAGDLIVDLRNLSDKLKSGRSTILKTTTQTVGAQHLTTSDPTPGTLSRTANLRLFQTLFAVTAVALAALAFFYVTQEPPSPEPPFRKFSFTPESLYSSGHYPRAAVSPDGRWIAYISGDEPAELWLRSMESEQPRKLDGTEGVMHSPFWSRDSRFVGFAAEGDLKKVAVSGETLVVLCQIPAGNTWSGAAWSPDSGRIIFSAGRPRQLHEVSALGGKPRVLFEPVEGDKGRGNFSPHFLPGEAVRLSLLFDVGVMTSRDIYLWDFETGESVRLAEGSRPFYSPTGHVLYQPRPFYGGIWALPFSLETLRPTGEAFPVSENVGGPSLATDGTLVTVDVDGGEGQRLVWRDRRGGKIGEIGRPQAIIEAPEISPNGRLVAVYGLEHVSDGGDIWLHETRRAMSRRLTTDAARDAFPTWSPDGQELAFQTERQGNGDLYLQRVEGDGKALELAVSRDREAGSDFSPDGRTLIFGRKSETFDLWLLRRDEAGKVLEMREFLATGFSEGRPQISPDGRFVAYWSDESGVNEVYVRDFPAGARRWPVSVRGGGQPRWSADETELYYVEGNTLVAVEVSTEPEFRVGKTERLFADPSFFGTAWDYDVSADGRFVTVEDVIPEGETRHKPSIHITQNWYEQFRDREQD